MNALDNMNAEEIRSPAVADMFYPGDKQSLIHMVDALIEESRDNSGKPPVAVISPHAGYIYSGSIAAAAFAPFIHSNTKIHTVILVGPSHRVLFEGMAIPSFSAFQTPIGNIPLNEDIIDQFYDLPGVIRNDSAHIQEHSLEVQLPFLQRLLGNFSIVPIVTGKISPELIADNLEIHIGAPGVLTVISSDLSHYHDYETARKLDRATANAIENLDGSQIGHDHACGWVAIRALLELAKRKNLKPETAALQNSGDTATGSRNQVVGYGAFYFHENL